MTRWRILSSTLLDTPAGRIISKTASGFFSDNGGILAGNLAYLTLLTLFPFFIFCVSLAGFFGRTDEGLRAVQILVNSVPSQVADVLIAPINEVLASSTKRGLLTFGAIVTVWTAANFIETVRVIVLMAYDQTSDRSLWYKRLQSTLLVIASALVLFSSMIAQFVLNAARKMIESYLPWLSGITDFMKLVGSGVAPAILVLGIYGMFRALTPREALPVRHWPGALLTAAIWIAATHLLPLALTMMGSYNVTYGSLAGIIVTLLFFYVLGIGLVLGAQLNAALRLEVLRKAETLS
ncbi:YihY/virulence factor BrkB family protein [Pedomonas mirosovicensis]|uniref:YihY/virulence factor BrkB family protein n=1 Tax=Pedomonas mirosovicensis TaxID=2908641 RepID=UPI002168A316|nr:YihY/virulence factor BrkB family protein [Pedomonas mirosovicensis]MCH8684913.1 YihY/virulence factor BrkB family protein [Pedomonas mirosovicensis]